MCEGESEGEGEGWGWEWGWGRWVLVWGRGVRVKVTPSRLMLTVLLWTFCFSEFLLFDVFPFRHFYFSTFSCFDIFIFDLIFFDIFIFDLIAFDIFVFDILPSTFLLSTLFRWFDCEYLLLSLTRHFHHLDRWQSLDLWHT